MDIQEFLCRNQSNKKRARDLLFNIQNGRCVYCNRQCHQNKTAHSKDERNSWFVLDHIIPVAKGGTDFFSNMTGSCWLCNVKKSDKILST